MASSSEASPDIIAWNSAQPTKHHPDVTETEQSYNDADTLIRTRSWGDIFSVICAGFALISDGYQNNLMTLTNVVFSAEYPKDYDSTMKTRVSNSLLIGEIVGQILIGLTCDYMGRKWAMTATTAMIVVGGILATAAHGTTTTGMFWMIVIARGLVGVGCGGEYPASSTASAEGVNAITKRRGFAFIMVTNFPLALGGPICTIVFLIVWEAAGGANHYSTVWRVCFGLGCVWPLSVFIIRLKMTTSKLYTKGAMRKNVPYWLAFKFYKRRLLGTCGAWALYDFVVGPNGTFSATIISTMVKGKGDTTKTTAEWNLLLGVFGLPGVIIGALLVDKIGRKYTMMAGFSGYIAFGLGIGLAYDKLSQNYLMPLFIVLYGLLSTFGNLGPGDCLGLTSSESYATGIRGTAYGLSAACGKAGAAIGTQVFVQIQEDLGKKWTFIIAAIVGVVGVAITFFCIPHLKEDDLMYEDKRFARYLRQNGWDGDIGLINASSDDEDHSDLHPHTETDITKDGTIVREGLYVNDSR